MTTLIGPEKLLEIISEPNLADAGPGDVSAIALDLRDQCLNEQEVSRVKQWLTHQPVVIVGLVNENRQLIDALDLAVDSNAEVETSLNAIHRNSGYPRHCIAAHRDRTVCRIAWLCNAAKW